MTTTLPDRPAATPEPGPAVPQTSAVPAPPAPPRIPAAERLAVRPVNPGDQTPAIVSSAFTMLAIVCLWCLAQMLFLGGFSQARDQEILYGELRTELAGATAPVGPVVPLGDPVALLQIPQIGLKQVIVEGTDSGTTLAGPGHQRNSALPGQVGTSVVMGRAATYGAPFAHLDELQVGDQIRTVGGQGEQTFTVVNVRRPGDPQPQPLADGAARITLVSAEGNGRLSAITPGSVLYVDADAETGFPAPSGRPATVPDSEYVMANDPGALPLLALHLAVLLALTLGVIAARQRWSTALVWVVAGPLALALSWATTDVVMRLLPNVI